MKDTRGSMKFFIDQDVMEAASVEDSTKFCTGNRKQAMATPMDNRTAK